MPKPHIVIVDNVHYRMHFTYHQIDYLNGKNSEKKQEVFAWVVNRLAEFIGARDPNFQQENMGTILILQVNEEGYQDTQMSQDSMAIEHQRGRVLAVHRQPFTEKKKSVQCEVPATSCEEVVDDSEDVIITNDDNTDVSLPPYSLEDSSSQEADHSYTRRRLSLKKKPALPAPLPTMPSSKTISKNAVPKKKEEIQVNDSSSALCSATSSQQSLFDVVDSNSDASTMDTTQSSYYDTQEFDNTEEEDKLDDIPHVMDPTIAQFAQMSQSDSGNKGIGKKSGSTSTATGGKVNFCLTIM